MTTLAKVNRDTRQPSLSYWMDDWLSRDFNSLFPTSNGWNLPKVNVRELDDTYILDLVAPGLSKSDFNLQLDNGLLTISSEMTNEMEDNGDNFTRKEFTMQSFKRTFTLPDTVNSDKVSAEYTDGILHIMLPKLETAKKKPAKEIKVK